MQRPLFSLLERFHRSFIMAGHDTTASTMAFILWELGKHPEDQERVRHEVATVLSNETNEAISSSDYDGMVYLNAVIKVCLVLLRKLHSHTYFTGGSSFVSNCA
jgi:hypothetical protein